MERLAFWRKKAAPVSLTDLLSREEYMPDFQAAEQAVEDSIGTAPELLALEASCGQVSQRMVQCMDGAALSDPQCILLHHAFLSCAARQLAPALHAAYTTCATKKKGFPERCDAAFAEMSAAVNGRVAAINANLRKDILSDEDAELMLDCEAFKDTKDGSMEEWLRCSVPKRCPTQYEAYAKCVDKNGSDNLGACTADGRPLVTCLSDMVARESMRNKFHAALNDEEGSATNAATVPAQDTSKDAFEMTMPVFSTTVAARERRTAESPMDEIDRWIAEVTADVSERSPTTATTTAVKNKRRNSVMLPSPVVRSDEPKKSGLGKVMMGLTRGRSSSDVTQLAPNTTAKSRASNGAIAVSSSPPTSSKEAGKVPVRLLEQDVLVSQLTEMRTSLKQHYDAWKLHEKVCEVLMAAIIAKEKGTYTVPQDKEKLALQLKDCAERVKAEKGVFLMEKQNLKNKLKLDGLAFGHDAN